jgi:hypothetical protein
MQNTWAAVTSWAVAALALMDAYQGSIMFFLGLILMIARLSQELPKALEIWKKWFKRDE